MENSKMGTDSTTIRVKLSKRKWATITRIYTPSGNSSGQNDISFYPDDIPTSDGNIIMGDLNGQSVLWDLIQPSDN